MFAPIGSSGQGIKASTWCTHLHRFIFLDIVRDPPRETSKENRSEDDKGIQVTPLARSRSYPEPKRAKCRKNSL